MAAERWRRPALDVPRGTSLVVRATGLIATSDIAGSLLALLDVLKLQHYCAAL